jgi:hypothetical protein
MDALASSDAVYLVKVRSESPAFDPTMGKITFTITEVLRGANHSALKLSSYGGADFKPESEWVLYHHPTGLKDSVGWLLKGDCEWLPIRVTRADGTMKAEWIGSLDKLRKYLELHPFEQKQSIGLQR